LLLAFATAVPVAASAGLQGSAAADPVYPSQGDVAAAQAAAAAKAGQVASLQAQLAAQQDQLDAAQTKLSVAAEDYDEAQALLQQRTTEATAAEAAADRAAAAYEQARTALGRVASEQYRGGSDDYSPLATVVTTGDIEDYVNGQATLDHLAGNRADVQQQAADAKALAQSTAAQAAAAKSAQEAATAQAATARAAAQQAADAADAVVAATQQQTNALLAQLATLQQTTVQLEQQRQAGIEAERQAAAAAAAQAAAQAAARSSAGGGSAARVRRAAGPTAGANTAVDWALAQLGKPYLWAADGPDSFDCSGLTMQAWGAAGVSLPHSSRMQYSGEAKVDLADLEPGDLVFYATDTSDPSTIHHVGMVIAPGTMVEAPHTGANVRTSSIYRSGLMSLGTRPS
jgi:cell wall-associated NlpC family hydrolase